MNVVKVLSDLIGVGVFGLVIVIIELLFCLVFESKLLYWLMVNEDVWLSSNINCLLCGCFFCCYVVLNCVIFFVLILKLCLRCLVLFFEGDSLIILIFVLLKFLIVLFKIGFLLELLIDISWSLFLWVRVWMWEF